MVPTKNVVCDVNSIERAFTPAGNAFAAGAAGIGFHVPIVPKLSLRKTRLPPQATRVPCAGVPSGGGPAIGG